MSDTFAKILRDHTGHLSLEGLTILSDAATHALSRKAGALLRMTLDELSESAATIYRKHVLLNEEVLDALRKINVDDNWIEKIILQH